jgi:hypothetical protein
LNCKIVLSAAQAEYIGANNAPNMTKIRGIKRSKGKAFYRELGSVINQMK